MTIHRSLPNFLVVGAPRSGTTSVYEHLNAHPHIYMSPTKEPDFFALPSLDAACGSANLISAEECEAREAALKADLERYTALFAGARDQSRRGEASAVYLGHPTAAQHIRRYVPEAKLIAILRDPSERMHSHYLHAKRIWREAGNARVDSARELEAAKERALTEGCPDLATTEIEGWVRSGFYYRHLTRFLSIFPAQQIRVFLFEDLVRDVQGMMTEIFRFLEVDDSFILPTTAAFNATVRPRSPGLFRLFSTQNPIMRVARRYSPARMRATAMRARNRLLGAGKPELDLEFRRAFVRIYRSDIEQLQGLLGRDLSSWLVDADAPYDTRDRHAQAQGPVSGTLSLNVAGQTSLALPQP